MHLLPSFDIASIEEDRAAQQTPDCDLASLAGRLGAAAGVHRRGRGRRCLQLGLRPVPLLGARGLVRDRTRRAGHASASSARWSARSTAWACRSCSTRSSTTPRQSGQDEKSVLDQVVPGYYQRLNAAGGVETSTCCQNVATEHEVAEKLMVDSRRAVGARVQGRRLPLRPHGPPLEGEHARDPRRARRADAQEGRRRRQGDLPVRRGLELRRGREQRALRAGDAGAARRHRHRHVQRPSPRRRARRQPGRASRPTSRASARASHRSQRPRRRHARGGSSRELGQLDRPREDRARGQPARLRADGRRRHRQGGRRDRLQRRSGRLRRPARRDDQLRRRARQQHAVRPVGAEAARATPRWPSACG